MGVVVGPRFYVDQSSTLWDGLLAGWNFDNNANDVLGVSNGTLFNGATYATGLVNQALSLNGINQYCNLGGNLDFTGTAPFSIAISVKPSVVNNNMLLKKENSNKGYFLFFFSGKLRFGLQNSPGTNTLRVDTTTTFTAGSWYTIVITYNGNQLASGITIDINGTQDTLTTISNNLTASISNVNSTFLGNPVSGLNYFNGLQDRVYFWNRVLTPAERTELTVLKQYPN